MKSKGISRLSTIILIVVVVAGVAVPAYFLFAQPSTDFPTTVQVSGKLISAPGRVGATPKTIDFTDVATGQKFSAPVNNSPNSSEYSIKLPNNATYRITLTIAAVYPGSPTTTVDVGQLALNVNTQSYTYDIKL